MADYFAILKRAVGALPDENREQRQAVYDKARKALLAQLQQMDPPLAPSEISKQRVALEEAIRSVEQELSKAADSAESDQQKEVAGEELKDEAVAVGVAPVVELNKDTKATGQLVSERKNVSALQDAEKVSGHVRDAENTADNQDDNDGIPSQADKVVRRAGQDVLKNAVRDANALGSATSAAVKSAQETADIVGEKRENDAARIEPTLGDAVVSNSKTYHREQEVQKSNVPEAKVEAPPFDEKEEKQSQSGLVIAVLLLAAALGVSAYLLYQNKEAFLGDETTRVAGSGADETPAPAADQIEGNMAEELPAKTVRTVKVTNDGVASTASPDDGSNHVASLQDNVEVDGTSQKPSEQPDVTQQASEQSSADISQPGLAVAQRSIFYEEQSAGSSNGRATQGQAVWSLEGKGDDATVKVDVDVPDRNVAFSISLKKNLDPELPASHLIEVISSHNNPDEPVIIDSIPGLILKPTEQSRGVGLAGAAIRIADNMYWIALKSEPQAIRYNMELLVLRSWIDMPILYKSGRRAILTLEKGDVGEAIVKDALLEWGLAKNGQ